MHKRNHRRAIIVDGRIGYTGGAAVMDKWMGAGRSPEAWRDSLVEVRGPIASNLQSAFTSLWTHVTGEMLAGPQFYGGDGEEETTGRRPGEPISRHVNVISSPSGEAHPMRLLYWLSFRAACESIYITNPYFVPDDIMRTLLMERARAGVDVRVLVPNDRIDIRLIRWASRASYEEMLESGMRIYEYQPAMIHQKAAVMDGKWSIVGSTNMDVRSKELNQENALGMLDVGFAKQVTETFFTDLNYAIEVDLEKFRRRPLHNRILERMASLFEEQF
jgi:cardiolipin synthase